MRINKFLASIGIASRRKIDKMIGEGRVKVNSHVAKLGDQIDPTTDQILIDNKKIGESRGESAYSQKGFVYIILNKPKGYTSTAAEFPGEKSVLELVRSKTRVYPVGRLDKDSTGLILLTNDGELTQKLTHPKFHIPKTYEVMVKGNVPGSIIDLLSTGVQLEEGITKPADVSVLSKTPHHTWLKITLYEGRKRQIRRMAATLHLHVEELKRSSIGQISLGTLPIGKSKILTDPEIKKLKEATSKP